ncbi:transmembrane exosortase [bacterium BMS3Abin06]|nr:transmembrane exosortase [bacterium BMS3Abin06]HDZ01897.1 exosortase [Nitrospirota bacterium]
MMDSSAANNYRLGLITLRNILFLLFNIITIVIFYVPLRDLFSLSLHEATYSHIMLIPLISGYFIYLERKIIFSVTKYSFIVGSIFMLIGITLYQFGKIQSDIFNQNDYLSIMTLASILFWFGGFVVFYGIQSFRNMRFPFLFLIFMVPIPAFILDRVIIFLQKGSAELSYRIFNITGVAPMRDGFTFHFPSLSIEVAEQCSGIRSSIALFITSVIAGHFFLKTNWRKTVLCLIVFPVAVFKNAVRIVTITMLSIYVDESFLTNSLLHKKGGILFFILALFVMAPVLWLLRKSEKSTNSIRKRS